MLINQYIERVSEWVGFNVPPDI